MNTAAINRRQLLKSATLTAVATGLSGKGVYAANAAPNTAETITATADNEAYWASIAKQYDVTRAITHVENGNWGMMARPVMETYIEATKRVNFENSYYARRQFGKDFVAIRDDVANRLGVKPTEVALTRGATEALKNIIGGYNRLTPGDTVMMADLDYGSIQACMTAASKRVGCSTVMLSVPEPASHDDLIAFYEEAFDKHPKTRLLLLTHISHRTGLVMPVKAIAERARARNIDVVVDAAHSWGQMDFSAASLGADFIGFNLHKWIGAPLGVGAMVIRESKLKDIDPDIAAGDYERDRIEGRIHTGTSNFAALLSVPAAFTFHDSIGGSKKEARLRYLRNIWVQKCRPVDGIDILTGDDSRLHAGITSFRFSGQTSAEQNKAVAKYLLENHGVFTVHRTGVNAGACIRVTPALFNSADDMEKTARAIIDARQKFGA
ncbi:isopenicillin-N epimerase [Kordiimonas sediminis]|uniref:Isopenicillin-N epimerase n=1 Tax=Kordiimonas sediminis TaxID=1735581 RepID=A0A919AJZ8_9PROT|nr:aminotransferase class V-fold PLP-dependent enzyme [Kordiimonas sediminis]GHF13349.1 isopenicillin-N epimerase [Kordiimonas sediminis]